MQSKLVIGVALFSAAVAFAQSYDFNIDTPEVLFPSTSSQTHPSSNRIANV